MKPVPDEADGGDALVGKRERLGAATTADAAVRAAEMIELSQTGKGGKPVYVTIENQGRRQPRGIPLRTFCGKLEIHLIPATSNSPPRNSGQCNDARNRASRE